MTERTIYTCDVCQTEFIDDEDACLDCELGHILEKGSAYIRVYDHEGKRTTINRGTWDSIYYVLWNSPSSIAALAEFEYEILGCKGEFSHWVGCDTGFIRYDSRRYEWEDAQRILDEAAIIEKIKRGG